MSRGAAGRGLAGLPLPLFGNEAVVYGAGNFVPPSSGEPFPGRPVMSAGEPTGDWEGYTLSGLNFSHLENQKATMPIFAPSSWATVNVNLISLAESFGSGTARFFHSGDTGTAVDIEVAASYVGVLFPAFTFNAGPAAWGLQFANLTITREADHANDDLTQGLAILGVVLTRG